MLKDCDRIMCYPTSVSGLWRALSVNECTHFAARCGIWWLLFADHFGKHSSYPNTYLTVLTAAV